MISGVKGGHINVCYTVQSEYRDLIRGYLRDFKLTCDIWAIPEGTPIFPKEPIVTVKGPIIELFLIETLLLLNINHQSLIATKTSRIVSAAKGRTVMEFGARRAHSVDAAVLRNVDAVIGSEFSDNPNELVKHLMDLIVQLKD